MMSRARTLAPAGVLAAVLLLAGCGKGEPPREAGPPPTPPPSATEATPTPAAPETSAPAAAPPAPRLDPDQEREAKDRIAELGSDDLDAGFRAAEALAKLGPAVVPLVGPKLRAEAPILVRWHAARVLGEIGSRAGVRYLWDGMKDASPSVRIASAESLVRVMDSADEVSMTELISILLNDTEPIVKAYTARAMFQVGNLMGIPTLVANLDKKLWPREVSNEALKEISGQDFGFDPYAPEMDRRASVERWQAWFREFPDLQRNLIGYLGVYKFLFAETAKNILIDLGSHAAAAVTAGLEDPNGQVRAHCAEILGTIGERSAVEVLVQRLGDEVSVVRLQAAIALGKMASPDAVPGLARAAVDDPDLDVRFSAVVALGKIATTATVAALDHVASRTEEAIEVRDLARMMILFGAAGEAFKSETALALERRGNPIGIPVLVRQLRGAPLAREGAATWLRQTFGQDFGFDPAKDPSAQPEALARADAWCAGWLVERISSVREQLDCLRTVFQEAPDRDAVGSWSRAFVPVLGAIVSDKASSEHDRFRATELLGWIGDSGALPSLGGVLREDPSMMVREAAAHALGRIGDPKAARDLEAALQDRERYVRLAAVKALATAGDAQSIRPLGEAARANALDSEIVSDAYSGIRAIQLRAKSGEASAPGRDREAPAQRPAR